MAFTGLPELDVIILLQLHIEDVRSTSGVSRRMHALCRDDCLWKELVGRDFGRELVPFKDDRETYKIQYRRLVGYKNQVCMYNADRRTESMHHDLLLPAGLIRQWKEGNFPIGKGAILTASFGNFYVLKWLHSIGAPINSRVANAAAVYGRIGILKWLASLRTLPDEETVNALAGEGKLHVVKFLESIGLLPNQDGANAAAGRGHKRTVKWLMKRKILPTNYGAHTAATLGHLKMVHYLHSHGIVPTERVYVYNLEIRLALMKYGIDCCAPDIIY